jgi:hypothetical protein
MVLHLPEAMYGNVLPVTVAFSRAWIYATNDDGEFTTSSLASQFVYDGFNYRIDEPVGASVPISLYVNGSQIGTNVTDANGLASFQYPLGFSRACSNLSLNCTANCSGLVFQQVNVTRNVTFTNVTVNDTDSGNGVFQLGCTVDGQGASYGLENGPIYIGTDNQVGLSAMLNGSPVSSAPASALVGKPLNRTNTNSSGCAAVAHGSTFLRVDSLYDLNSAAASSPSADINRDGKVDGKDLGTIAKAYGTYPGISRWNWRADVNFDMKVDGKDLASCAKYFGSNFSYVSVPNYSGVNVSFLVNGQWNNASLDGSGCADATDASCVSFTLGGSPVGAVVEFFNCTSGDQACFTDDSGQSVASWVPPETGNCSSVSSGLVMLKGYLALVWLPLSFQAVTSQESNVTSDHDPVILAIALNVVTRPVSLVLTSSSYEPSTVIENPVDAGYVTLAGFFNYTYLMVGYHWTSLECEYRTYVRFDISNIPADSTILSARIEAYCYQGSTTLGDSRTYGIYRITEDWTDNMVWGDQPPHLGYYSSVSWDPRQMGWWSFDVTEDVRSWYNGSAPNYGHVIMDTANPPPDYDPEEWVHLYYDRAIPQDAGNPLLEVTYVPNEYLPVSLEANLVDGVSGAPISDSVNFSVVGSSWQVPTGSGGVATTYWWDGPQTSAAYNVVASYAGDATHQAASASLCLDFRIITNLQVNEYTAGQNVIDVSTHEGYHFNCWVNPPIMASEGVLVFVNGGSYANLTLGSSLPVSFDWTANSPGVYYINVSYGGDQNYALSQLNIMANAQASPVCLGFNVTPSEFKPGTTVTLYAQAVNPIDGQPLAGVKVQFLQDGISLIGQSQYIQTGSDGVATVSWQYPADGTVCTVLANVTSDNSVGNCSLAEQPVTLTVGNETRLLLEAWRDPGGTGHTIYARLLATDGSYISNQTVTLTVNGTAYPLMTNGTGYVSLHLALQPGDTSANMYQVLAIFNGTNPLSASLNASDPYGD